MPRSRRIQPKTRPAVAPGALLARDLVHLVVADSQAIDRGGLVRLLEDQADFQIVGEAASVEETIQQCRALKPDVLVLSLNMISPEGESAMAALRSQLPTLRILALSERGTDNCLVLNPPGREHSTAVPKLSCTFGIDCLQLAAAEGAMATVRRSADPEELFRAIRAVAQGQAWYDPSTASGMLSRTGAEGTRTRLSERELQVAALIADGLSNKEIARSLVIGEPTVKKHVGRILEKLGLADRLQAGLYIARNPLVLKR